MGVVEAEGAGLQLAQADVAVDAGELLRIDQLFGAGNVDQHGAARHFQGGLDGVCHAGGVGALTRHQPVDHDLDGVPLLLVQVELLAQVVVLAVDADPYESG